MLNIFFIVGKGVKEGDLVLTRRDWNLQFAKLAMHLAGKYRCEVTTASHETYASLSYQLLIVGKRLTSRAHHNLIHTTSINLILI